jgi:hypothetical protein
VIAGGEKCQAALSGFFVPDSCPVFEADEDVSPQAGRFSVQLAVQTEERSKNQRKATALVALSSHGSPVMIWGCSIGKLARPSIDRKIK